jgi:SMI1-KNR4 cell-wall
MGGSNMSLIRQTWLDDFYPDFKITANDLAAFEEKNKCVLPALYKKHLIERNGGRPKCSAVPVSRPTTWASDHHNIHVILGLRSSMGILDSNLLSNEWKLPVGSIVFAFSEDNAFFYFDYSQTNHSPPVKVHEPDGDLKGFKVADSYEAFVSSLYTAEAELSDKDLDDVWEETEEKWADPALFDQFIQDDDDIGHLLEGIIFYSNSEDVPWLLQKVAELSYSKHEEVRVQAAEVLTDIAAYSADEIHLEILDKTILCFTKDPNPDVRYYIEEVIQRP